MPAPTIVNRKPDVGESDVGAEQALALGLRDQDTRVDLASVYMAVLYSRANYQPDVLPIEDVELKAEAAVSFSHFNDAAGASAPNDPADQTIETVGLEQVYRVEHTVTASQQEGILYVTRDVQENRPVAVVVRLAAPVTSTASFEYVIYPDFTGAMVGLIYWPRRTGVFVFLRDDGFSKFLTVAGPSSDGVGTRPVEDTVAFDWSTDSFTYKIVWDETPQRRKVSVLAESSDGLTETLLSEFSTTDFNPFLSQVKIAGILAGAASQRATLVAGTDARTMGDYVDVYGAVLHTFGKALVDAGNPTGQAEVSVAATESIFLDGTADADEWVLEGDAEVSNQGNTLRLAKETDSDPSALRRTEPDLARQRWLVLGSIQLEESSHDGTYSTGVGVDVEDGTSRFSFRLLDDFADTTAGVYDYPGNAGLLESYQTVGDLNWGDAFQFMVVGDSPRDEVRLYVGSDEVVAATQAYSSGHEPSSEQRLRLGFLDQDADYGGNLFVSYLWVFLDCRLYEPRTATPDEFPEAQGWTRVTSAAARAITADLRLRVDSDPGGYDVYYVDDAEYVADSGLAIFFKVALLSWTDSFGAEQPPRVEVGPLLSARVETSSVQLFFIRSEAGEVFAYLPRDDTDYVEVLRQSVEGRRISTQVQLEQQVAFILVVKPRQYVRLYADYSVDPLIDVPWQERATVLRSLPSAVPSTAVAAFGAMGDAGVQADFAFVRASLGRGYDLRVRLDATDAELETHVYGSLATFFLDFQDSD